MKYDAFISYRHGGVDQFVAETLHKKLEAFKLPKRLYDKSNGKKKITRVFRDQDELPLSSNLEDSIKDALRESEWLIVICTPRLKESIWCLKEIETFTEMHGQDHILAVLVEGEPYESFPESLRSHKVTKVDIATGKEITFEEKIEPLAADVRADSKGKIKKALETEILRLLAPMFGVDFDDLKQRQRARKVRRVAILATIVVVLSMGFGTFAGVMYLKISDQNRKIEKINKEVTEKNDELEEKNEEIQQQKDKIEEQMGSLLYNEAKNMAYTSLQYNDNNKKMIAIQTAYNALTGNGQYNLPMTSYGQLALSEALDIYHYDYIVRCVDEVDFGVQIVNFSTNGTINYLLVETFDGRAVLYDYYGKTVLFEYNFKNTLTTNTNTTRAQFVDENEFAIADGTQVHYFEINGSDVSEIATYSSSFPINSIYTHGMSNYLITSGYDNADIIDNTTKTDVYNCDGFSETDISYDGTRIAAVVDGYLTIYDRNNLEEPICILDDQYFSDSFELGKIAISNDSLDPNVVIVEYCYNDLNDFTNYETRVYAINVEEGSIIWRQTVHGYKMELRTVSVDGTKAYVIYNEYSLRVLDRVTGEVIGSFEMNAVSEKIKDIIGYDDFFAIITSGGTIYNFNNHDWVMTLHNIDVKNSSITNISIASSDYGLCYPAVTNENTSVTVFAYNYPAWMEELDSYTSAKRGGTIKIHGDARDLAEELGVPEASLVDSIFCSEDADRVIIMTSSYIRTYDYETMTLLYETTFVPKDSFFYENYAIDSEGNFYLFLNDGALVFDENGELIAYAMGAFDLDEATDKMIFSSIYNDLNNGSHYAGKLKTVEELLEIAEIKLGI